MYLASRLKKVILFSGNIDFRKRFDGLLAQAYRMGCDPYAGDCVIFVSRDRHQLRAIFGDRFGLFLVCRRFEGGRLAQICETSEISLHELTSLFQGAQIKDEKQVRAWRK